MSHFLFLLSVFPILWTDHIFYHLAVKSNGCYSQIFGFPEVNQINTPDMRIVPLGSGGAILYIDRFLNYRDIKLVIQVSGFIGLLQILRPFQLLGSFKIEVIRVNEVIIA
jgi:hypothetical protein